MELPPARAFPESLRSVCTRCIRLRCLWRSAACVRVCRREFRSQKPARREPALFRNHSTPLCGLVRIGLTRGAIPQGRQTPRGAPWATRTFPPFRRSPMEAQASRVPGKARKKQIRRADPDFVERRKLILLVTFAARRNDSGRSPASVVDATRRALWVRTQRSTRPAAFCGLC